MMRRARPARETVSFFALVILLSVPFWLLGAATDATVTATLSVASLMVVAPFLAAVLLTSRGEGGPSVRDLLARALDPRLPGGAGWYVPLLLLMPAAVFVEVGVLRLAGRDVPDFEITPLVLVADLALFWVAATFEEVGWTGYATDRLLTIGGRLATALLIGIVWALWHVPAMLEMPGDHSWTWILLQCLNLVIVRILIVWIYVGSGGSLFAAIGLHAVLNVSTLTLFPVYGSHYDPLVANLVLGVAAILVVLRWTPLSRDSLRRGIERLGRSVAAWRQRTARRGGGGIALGLVLGPALGYVFGLILGDDQVALAGAGVGAALGLILGSAVSSLDRHGSEHAR